MFTRPSGRSPPSDWQTKAQASRRLSPASARTVPVERAQVRAYLYPGPKGGWEGAGSDWFELTTKELAGASAGDPPPAAAERSPGSLGPRTDSQPRRSATTPGRH